MKLQLTRNYITDTVTLGYIGDRETDFFLYTLENPWQNNEPYLSCIPLGNYKCKRKISPTFGETFEVRNVKGRTHILFHTGNSATDTSGCILLGKKTDPTQEKTGDSRVAMGEFMDYTQGLAEFDLEIITNYPL